MFDYAIQLSQQLNNYGAPWSLNIKNRMPHLSLFHFPLAEGKSVENVIEVTSHKIAGGSLNLTGISSPRHGAMFLDTDRPEWLISATEQLSELLWGLEVAEEDSLFTERWNQLQMTPAMLENIRRWHSPFMDSAFLPHFTLGFLPDHDLGKDLAQSLEFKPASWPVETLQLVEVGEGWTAQRIVGEIPLLPSA